jgi:hypothetical protein
MKCISRLFLLFAILATSLPISIVQAQDTSPWSEVFDENGKLRSDVVDLGVTTETPSWMSVDLPFDQSLQLDANYHRFQTAEGNVVIVPSASTLFFMAMNPQESGLAASAGMMSNGYGSMISFLGLVAGDSLDWNRLQSERPQYKDPSQFWGAVLSGQENAWTWFSGWSFITKLLSMSFDDAAMRNAYLMYLNGARNCTLIPGGCSGIANPGNPEDPPHPVCPGPEVTIQQPTLTIQKLAPANPLVVGQDPEKRGADVQATVTIPPVIFVWYEPIYKEEEFCRSANAGETPSCKTNSASVMNDGVEDSELVFKECLRHVENLPDAVATLQATATLDGASKAWITSQLGQTHYGAYIHKESFDLVPGFTTWSGGCSGGTCTAVANALRIPFADPGKFNLKLRVTTSGTQFRGVTITQPRNLSAAGEMQVYVTLPALVP